MPAISTFVLYVWSGLFSSIFRFKTLVANILTSGWRWSTDQNRLLTLPAHEYNGTNRSPLFALLIGIDKYESESVKNLKGAVNATNRVFEYLMNSLGVPDSQIQVLLDEEATRESILSELSSIRDRSDIVKGDPILIYFAGHSGTGKAPTSWNIDGENVEMILPFDAGVKQKCGIPASTISMVLEDLSIAKGNNIVLVLDCDFYRQEMSLLPVSLDIDLWKSHKACDLDHSSPSFIDNDLTSHVVITSSGEGEKNEAFEPGGFSTGLIEHLGGLKTLNITYTSFLKLLPKLNGTTPRAGGNLETRHLFNGRLSKNERIPIPFKHIATVYKLEVGIEDGVKLGSLYDVYPDLISAFNASNAIGQMAVTRASLHASIMSDLQPGVGHGLQHGFAVLKEEPNRNIIHMDVSDELLPIISSLNDGQKVIEVAPKLSATLGLSYHQKTLGIAILDERVEQTGLTNLTTQCELGAENLQPMIKGLAYYHWMLNRTSDITSKKIASIDVFKLITSPGRYTRDLRPYRVADGQSVVVDGTARIKASRYMPYGIKVTNHTNLDLYAYLFFFDNYDFSIMPYYLSSNASPSLGANKSIKVGYEDSGSPPVIYYLRPGANVEVGFIKLFVSTRPLDMSHVQQSSTFPLSTNWSTGYFDDRDTIWGTTTAKIVQLLPDSKEN